MIRTMVEQEGRTVFISSHLLDEVEKICDAAAIVDRGKIITQGPIAELAERRRGARNELIVGVDDVELALAALGASELVREAQPLRRGPARGARRAMPRRQRRGSTRPSCARASACTRLEPVRHSLEQRFLEVTSRLDATRAHEPAGTARVRQ